MRVCADRPACLPDQVAIRAAGGRPSLVPSNMVDARLLAACQAGVRGAAPLNLAAPTARATPQAAMREAGAWAGEAANPLQSLRQPRSRRP